MARRKNKTHNKIPVKFIVFSGLILSLIITLWAAAKAFLSSSPYFKITKVSIEGAREEKEPEFKQRLIGRNIFLQDLSLLKKQIEQDSSDIECIAISRRLPGELLFLLRKRIALLQIKLGRFYPVDQTGSVMGRPSDLALENLPVVSGVEEKAAKPKAAKFYSLLDVRKVIELLQEKDNSSVLSGYKITKVNVARGKSSSFFIIKNFIPEDVAKNSFFNPEIEVKFDLEKPRETIRVLAPVLAKRKNSSPGPLGEINPLADIKYIDLENTNSPIVSEQKAKVNNRL